MVVPLRGWAFVRPREIAFEPLRGRTFVPLRDRSFLSS
jgi:hypothetical protein